jgi:NADPH-dependent 7-cyano-7-deazaguanine reductase QueF
MENAAAPAAVTRLSQDARPQEPVPELATFDSPTTLTSQTLTVDHLGKLCPATGRPDWFSVKVTSAGARCLELDSLVRHLEAYWTVAVSAEVLAHQLAAAVVAATGADRVTVTVHQSGREGADLHVTARHPTDAPHVDPDHPQGLAAAPAPPQVDSPSRLHRDAGGTVWLSNGTDQEVRLKDLPPDEVTDILDELVHDAKAAEASDINNGGQADQLAYLLA